MSTKQAKIYQFPSGTGVSEENGPVGSSIGNETNFTRGGFGVVVDSPVLRNTSTGRIAVEDLYPEMIAVRPELSGALRLLARSAQYLDEALDASTRGNAIIADDAVQRFQAVLPELFSCRALGDGFGAIVNAVINATSNQRGEFLSRLQTEQLKRSVLRLRSEPFIEFDEAVSEIMKMEDAGFSVEPREFDVLADWLDE